MKYQLIIIVFCSLITFQGLAQEQPNLNVDANAMDTYIKKQMVKKQVPGVTYVIVQDGKVVAQNSFGVTKHDGDKVTAATPFATPFISNSFLTLSILQLEEKGMLDLDDPVIKHIPWFTLKDTEQSNKITIQYLLDDQSGISTLDGETFFKKTDASPNTMENLVREFSAFELEAEPGTKAINSNASYGILALLLEKISGQLIEDYYQEHILTPLGMTDSFVNNINPKIKNRAYPHRYWFGQVSGFELKPNRRGAIVYVSANDAAKYMTALLQKDERLLSTAGFEAIFNTQNENRSQVAYAWLRSLINNSNFWSSGVGDGTTVAMALFTEQETGIAVFANSVSGFGWVNPEEMVYGPIYILQQRPLPIWSSTIEIIIYIIVCVVPLIFLFLIARLVRNRFIKKTLKRPSQLNIWFSLAGSLLLAWFLVYYLPTVAGGKPVPIEVVLIYIPDVAWALILGATFAIFWSLLRIILAYLPNENMNSN